MLRIILNSFLIISFFFLVTNLKSQSTENVDSLIKKLDFLEEGDEKLKVLLDISDKLNWIDKDLAVPYIDQSIEMARRLNNDIELGNALLERYENLMTSTNSDSLQYLRKEAEEAWRRADYKKGMALLLVDDALDAETSGNLSKSMQLFLESQDMFEDIADLVEYNANWVSLAGLMSSMGRNEEALKYLEKADDYTFTEGDANARGYYYLVQASIYKELGEDNLTKKAYQNCLEIAKDNDFLVDVVSCSYNLGKLAMKQDDLLKASQYYDDALETAINLKGKYYLSLARKGKANYHLHLNQFQEAKELLLQAKTILDEPVYTFFANDINRDLGLSYAGLLQYDSAFFSMKAYAIKQDSVHNKESKRIASELEAIYQNEKKEQELQQNAREQNFMYVIIGLLGLASLALLWAFRQKRKSNILLEEKNEQKEYLIKEIHHRVKNNLQIISSLLNLQSNVIEDDKAVSAVIEGRNRVQSMSLIHQKLYMGENLAEVDMQEYLDELSMHLLDTFGRSQNEIAILNKVEVPPLDVDTAIPLGLIINELLTNSLKYAFPDGKNGNVSSRLYINEDDKLVLIIEDNGEGSAHKSTPSNPSTKFGSNMVEIFSRKLKGKVEQVSSKDGFKTTITFQKYRSK